MIRVLVVDDQVVTRRGLRVLLDEYEDITVVGEADSGPSAVSTAAEVHPDVVIMDVRMPDGDGIAATRALSRGQDAVPVILITTFDVDEYVFGGLEAGAAGFLLKSADSEDLAAAVRAAARGDAVVAPALTRRVIAEFSRRRRARVDPAAIGLLSERELQIVRALVGGDSSNAEIGEQLHLEIGTVKAHLTRIMTKVDVHSRTQLAVWAFRNGLVE